MSDVKRKCCRDCRRERNVKKRILNEKPRYEKWLCDECGRRYKVVE